MSPSYSGPSFNKPCEIQIIKTSQGAPDPNLGISAEQLEKQEKLK
tara:strand:- start:2 stop:136 length:135 start_codon:yes stop_codon:yes gene_type:complete